MVRPTKNEIKHELIKVLRELSELKQPTRFELDIQKGKVEVLSEHWKTIIGKEADK
jgi:hypothetical protein